MANIKPGGTHHAHYKQFLSRIATFAHTAKGNDGVTIPVIFRPYHEFDGDWFWWGKKYTSRQDFIDVWRFTVSYLSDSMHVYNFIYAFSPDCRFDSEEEFLERYPGDDWVDIVGMDNYADFGRDGHYDLAHAIKKLKIVSAYAEKRIKLQHSLKLGWNRLLIQNGGRIYCSIY